HAGDADDIGAGDAVEVDGLDVLVEEGDGVRRRGEGGQQRQGGDGQVGPLAEQGQGVFEPPVGDLEAGVDEDNVHRAGPLPGRSGLQRIRARDHLTPTRGGNQDGASRTRRVWRLDRRAAVIY